MEGRYPNLFAGSTKLFSNFNTKLLGHHIYLVEQAKEDEEDEKGYPLRTILSLTNFGLSINLEPIPSADPDYIFGVLNLAT